MDVVPLLLKHPSPSLKGPRIPHILSCSGWGGGWEEAAQTGWALWKREEGCYLDGAVVEWPAAYPNFCSPLSSTEGALK